VTLAARTAVDRPSGARRLALEGAFQSLAQGLGEAYLGAYALLLGAGGLALGLVATLPTGATAAAQILARRTPGRAGGAKRLLANSWLAQAVGYMALGLCLIPPYPWSVVALVTVALFAWGCGGLAVPAWTSLVSALVPRSRHGWFFGLRGAAQAFGVLTAILSGGALLSFLTGRGHEALGFVLIFGYAALGRVLGSVLLAGLPEPARPEAGRPRPVDIKPVRSSRKFRRLSVYLWSLHFATHVSSPFFVPYMLRELRFTYLLVGVLIATPAIVKVATLRMWGKLADRLGPGPVLRTTGWLVAPVPALWLLSRSPWWILAAQVYSGLVWGAFELAQASSILQTTRARERQVAWLNAVDGGVLIAGSLLGGAVVNAVSGRGGSGYLAAMALSTVLRLVPAVGILWRLRGIGRPDWSHLMMPLRVWTVRPTRGLTLRVWEGIRLPGSGAARGSTARSGPAGAGRGRAAGALIQGSAAVEPETGRPVPAVLESPPRAAR
jgi:MFS family permease